mmetsp:Transcript_39010/g.94424  ORF Transcript_39010/g.94424 Transcript_39010/m.94424 type:complete len:556 (+) Transcript_39010:1515-3182(+)
MNRILHSTSTTSSRKLRAVGTYRSSRHNAHVYSSRLMSVISTTSSSSFSSSTSPSPSSSATATAKQHHRRQYHRCLQAHKSSFCCTTATSTSSSFPIQCQRPFGTSSSSTSDDENDHDEEEWIPPQRPIGKKSMTTSTSSVTATTSASSSTTTDTNDSTSAVVAGGIPTTNNSQQQEQAQLYTQQRRIDEATDALFVLTPEEEATLTDEELSRRVDEVLALEEELEQQAFEMELQQLDLQNETEGEEEEEEEEEKDNSPAEPAIDWLRTRRAALGESNDKNSGDNSSNSKLSSSSSSVIPVEEHRLLTRDEILTLLEFYGGHDIVVIDDDVQHPRMGGADGMIFCSTSPSSSSSDNGAINGPIYQYQQSFRVMALTRGLVEHMKERGLHEIGVPGAQLSLGKKSQQPGSQSSRRSGGSTGLGSSLESSSSSWQIIDCRNYIVHIMDPMTRSKFRLEALWTGKDPIWKLDWTDEDAVDKYVGDQQKQQHKQQRYDDDDNGDTGNPWDDGRLIHRLERTSFSTARHRPVIASSTKNRDRRAGRRQRRRLREQQFRSR